MKGKSKKVPIFTLRDLLKTDPIVYEIGVVEASLSFQPTRPSLCIQWMQIQSRFNHCHQFQPSYQSLVMATSAHRCRLMVLVLMFSSISALVFSQEPLLQDNWRTYFNNLTHFQEAVYNIKVTDFHARYRPGGYYPALLIYRDQQLAPEEVFIEFVSLPDLCNNKSPLFVKNKLNGSASSVNKSGIEAFVFDTYLFKHNYPSIRNSAYAKWGIVYLNGPICSMKSFTENPGNAGPIYMDSHTTLKYEKQIGADPKSLVVLNFKKTMSNHVKEHAELSAKVLNEVEGYKKQNSLTIIEEFNEYIRSIDNKLFRQYSFLHE